MKKPILTVVCTLMLLAGCASTKNIEPERHIAANIEGMLGELHRIDNNLKTHPQDVGLRTQRQLITSQLVNDYVKNARLSAAKNDYIAATNAWRAVLLYQPGNFLAQQGLKKIDSLRVLDKLYQEAVAQYKTEPELALQKIQQILEEEPNWPQAMEIRDHLMREIALQNQPEKKINRELRKPVSFNFSKHNLKDVFAAISQITGINIIYDKDVPDTATTSLIAHDTSAENALNLLLLSNQLRKKILNSNTLLIYPATLQKEKMYRDTVVKTVFLGYAKAKELNVALRNLIKIRDVHVDERTNSVTFRGPRESVEKAEQLLITLDRPEAEVTLAVEVLEVDAKDVESLGINYPGQIGIGLNSAEEGSSNIALDGVRKSNMFINLGSSQGLSASMQQIRSHARVLANPRIRVKNNKKATVDIGERIPVLTSSISEGFSQEQVEYQDVGLKLEVTPDISVDNTISMDVKFNLSTIGSAEHSKDGVAYYRTNNREAATVLSSQNGETQMLAGLIKDSESDGLTGLPKLAALPLLGKLFGNHESDHERTEVVLLITPSIERSIDLPGTHINTIEMGSEDAQGESAYLPPASTESDQPLRFAPPPLNPPAKFPPSGKLPAPTLTQEAASR
ncbi:secretin N-terminal domain-containing protein [Kosakonia sp. BYX6]|uniref:Secretin N-terminal domain-containing protein n=1 Tax=Kosakonia calanthes TaxID=3139408 RepID=A0ABZ3B2A2_9ENTR